MITIYQLRDPETDEIVYVGQSKNVEKRFKQHCDPARIGSRWIWGWLGSLVMLKLNPKIEIICEVDESKANKIEISEIRKAWGNGQPLMNNHSSIGVNKSDWRKRIRDCQWNQSRKRFFYFGKRFDTDEELE